GVHQSNTAEGRRLIMRPSTTFDNISNGSQGSFLKSGYFLLPQRTGISQMTCRFMLLTRLELTRFGGD
ncbi:MAG: hypothetical protein QGF68_13885, partial [Nitrospinota bacterium]|nr:hypothetical protein [Nitrospinota bacterium]